MRCAWIRPGWPPELLDQDSASFPAVEAGIPCLETSVETREPSRNTTLRFAPTMKADFTECFRPFGMAGVLVLLGGNHSANPRPKEPDADTAK